jgi:hypothetical protein
MIEVKSNKYGYRFDDREVAGVSRREVPHCGDRIDGRSDSDIV